MKNLQAFAAKIKGVSNSAKLLHGYMTATRITDSRQLADALDIPIRTIQRLKIEIAAAVDCQPTEDVMGAMGGALQSAMGATHGAHDAHDALESATDGALPRAPVVIPARATKESLRDESYQEVKQEPPLVPPKPIAEPKPLRSRGSRLSNEWTLPDDWKAWARTTFPATSDQIVTDEADKFRDYWTAKAGQGASKLDWQATWRNWCRTAFAVGKRRDGQPINHGRSAYDEQRAGAEHWLEERRRRMDETARICKIGKYRETPVESVQ